MYRKFGKRFLDIIISLSVMLLLSPVYLLTALAIYLESGKPVIFRQRRLGYKAKEFDIYKFRSMV